MSNRRRDVIIIGVVGIAFIIFISVFGAINMDKAPVFTLVLYAGLIVITMFYAYYSMETANAAREQADASVKMARETKEQRYSESLPLLVPAVTRRSIVGNLEPNEIDYQTLQTGVGIEVTWHNLGKCVAINTRFSFWAAPLDSHPGKVLFFPPRESEALEIEGRKEIKFSDEWAGQWYDMPEAYYPRLEAEYQDIYERKITTVQEFRIDEQNKRAFLGELYFTINGRRLGEEVTHHD
jgi:hypothetical protein